ncbi:hypothetical protein IWX47DRAFT_199695 [Phyllosticta citricarpa]
MSRLFLHTSSSVAGFGTFATAFFHSLLFDCTFCCLQLGLCGWPLESVSRWLISELLLVGRLPTYALVSVSERRARPFLATLCTFRSFVLLLSSRCSSTSMSWFIKDWTAVFSGHPSSRLVMSYLFGPFLLDFVAVCCVLFPLCFFSDASLSRFPGNRWLRWHSAACR